MCAPARILKGLGWGPGPRPCDSTSTGSGWSGASAPLGQRSTAELGVADVELAAGCHQGSRLEPLGEAVERSTQGCLC